MLNCERPLLNRLAVIRRGILAIPAILSRNQAWTDSSTTSACSGNIPVQLTVVRTCRAAGESGGVVLVDCEERTASSGEGSQGQHRINLQARGTGDLRFSLDRTTGEVVSVTGSSRTEIDVGSSGRVQRFVQTVQGRTVARN